MAYVKTTWRDEVVQHPKRFTATENDDGTLELDADFGTVVQQGTPLSAENLNKLENGVYDTSLTVEKYAKSRNLMGMEYGKYYKLDAPVTQGTQLYITRSDGTVFPTSNTERLYVYDENKAYVDYFSLKTGVASKTTSGMKKDIYYMRWYDEGKTGAYDVPMMVVRLADKALAYQEYFEDVRMLAGRVDDEFSSLRENEISDLEDGIEAADKAISSFAKCRNLMGMEYGRYYRIDPPLAQGEQLYITRSDGTVFPADNAEQLHAYDENMEWSEYFTLKTGIASKTTSGMKKATHYLRWIENGTRNGKYDVPMMVVRLSDKTLSYQKYFDDVKELAKQITQDVKIIFVHCGGLCILIKGSKNVLVDMGTDPNGTELIKACKAEGIYRIDYAFFTHFHYDHTTNDFASFYTKLNAAGITFTKAVFPHYGMDWSLFEGNGYDDRSTNQAAVTAALNTAGVEILQPNSEGYSIRIADEMSCKCYNVTGFPASYYSYMTSFNTGNSTGGTVYNDFSAVYRFVLNGKVFVVSADVDLEAQKRLYKTIGKCDILQVEHHSLNRFVHRQWAEALAPCVAVTSMYTDVHTSKYLAMYPGNVIYKRNCSVYSNYSSNVTVTVGDTISVSGGNLLPVMDADTDSMVNACFYEDKSSMLGISYNWNGDGSITANGSIAADADTHSYFYFRQRLMVETATEVIFGGCPAGGTDDTYRVSLGKHSGSSWSTLKNEYGAGDTYTLQPGTEYMLLCRIAKGATVENVTFRPYMVSIDEKAGAYIRSLDYRLKKLEALAAGTNE